VVGMTASSWPAFDGNCHVGGGDVHGGRRVLWTPVVHPPRPADVISHLELQGDFDDSQRRAESGLYNRLYSHDHHFRGLHLFDWFPCGHGEGHLHPFQFPRHIPSLRVVERCLLGLDVDMMRGDSSPRRK